MKFWIQIDSEGYISDCIQYPYSDYIPVEFETPLPDKFIARDYKYLGDNKFERDEERWDGLSGEDIEPTGETVLED